MLVVPHSHWGSNRGLQCFYGCSALNVSGVFGLHVGKAGPRTTFSAKWTLGSSLGSNWVKKYPPYQLVNLSSVNRYAYTSGENRESNSNL